MFSEEILAGDKAICVHVRSAHWRRVKKLAKRLGHPYSASLLLRKWMVEGLERMEKTE